jgi:hypothetical protein
MFQTTNQHLITRLTRILWLTYWVVNQPMYMWEALSVGKIGSSSTEKTVRGDETS